MDVLQLAAVLILAEPLTLVDPADWLRDPPWLVLVVKLILADWLAAADSTALAALVEPLAAALADRDVEFKTDAAVVCDAETGLTLVEAAALADSSSFFL